MLDEITIKNKVTALSVDLRFSAEHLGGDGLAVMLLGYVEDLIVLARELMELEDE